MKIIGLYGDSLHDFLRFVCFLLLTVAQTGENETNTQTEMGKDVVVDGSAKKEIITDVFCFF